MTTPSSDRGPVVATSDTLRDTRRGESPSPGASEGEADSVSPSTSGGEVPIGMLIDPGVDEPLPSTRPDGRAARVRAANLGTAASALLGVSDEPSSFETNGSLPTRTQPN